jgi:hypothetical protein
MNKTLIFANVHMTLEDGEVYQIPYYHKGFAVVALDEERVSLMPLNDEERDALLLDAQNIMNEVTDEATLKALGEIVGVLDASTERAKITR